MPQFGRESNKNSPFLLVYLCFSCILKHTKREIIIFYKSQIFYFLLFINKDNKNATKSGGDFVAFGGIAVVVWVVLSSGNE